MAQTKNKKNLEDMIKELEVVVSKLESGNLSLDKCLDEFERGVKLYKESKKQLVATEKKIQLLTDSLKEEDLS